MAGGDFKTVQRFIERAVRECHVELTTLIIPGENDSIEEMKKEEKNLKLKKQLKNS